MTIYLGDWSNHDWSRAGAAGVNFTAMAADGITGGWHKSSDGLNYFTDPYWARAIPLMRAAFGFCGPYHVLWGNRDLARQVDEWFALLDRTAPGWRDDPHFQVMTDNEPFGYNGKPTIDQVNTTGDLVRQRVGKTMWAYCPPWVYGAELARLRYPLVSSNYGSNPAAHYPDAYPGDASSRWNAAAPVAVLQFGSRTRMGVNDICDADAVRDHTILTNVPNATQEDTMRGDDGQAVWRLYAVEQLQETFDNHVDNPAEANPLAVAINGLVRDVAAIKATQATGGVDLDALAAKVDAMVEARVQAAMANLLPNVRLSVSQPL